MEVGSPYNFTDSDKKLGGEELDEKLEEAAGGSSLSKQLEAAGVHVHPYVFF